ncbi:IS5 family transposase [Candidatus Tisiphia endosymbiont of Ptychoptera albimana]|uniref:IS5 family transposase n=1 Tax=Candidatus Tisiphia endosymbiont of Ptychoptera albimana TaxID=3066260 RepID=UPI00312C70E4
MKYYIEEQAWEVILSFCKERNGIHNKNEEKMRHFIEAIWFIVRTGCQWRLIADDYGCWYSIYRRFKRCVDKGIWEDLMDYVKVDADMESIMIDATIVRAHACSSRYIKGNQEEAALGRSRGGFSTKIHALVDALGNPLKFILTAGQRNDITQAGNLTQDVQNTTVIADKGYDSSAFVESLENKGCEIVIPPKSNRKVQREYDKHTYKERYLIECLFGKIKHFRRIFSRFDKTPATFLAFLNFVGTLIWLR